MSFSDLLSVEDTLYTLKLKPWWETWRDYCFKGSLAVVFVAAFFPPLEFNCLPASDVRNEPLILEQSQFDTVNSYCNYTSIPWHIRYGDFLALGASIITFILTNYWIHATGVKKGLTDVSEIGLSIVELNITSVEMRNSCILPITAASEDKHHILRRNIQILFRRFLNTQFKENKSTNIWKEYIRRCIFVLVWTTICCSLVLYSSINQATSENLIVACEIPNDLLQIRASNSSNTFTCVDKTSNFISLLQLGFGIFVATQSITMIVALYSLVPYFRRYEPIFRYFDGKGDDNGDDNGDNNSDDNDDNNSDDGTKDNGDDNQDNLIRSVIFLIVMMGIDEGQAKNIASFCGFVTTSPHFVSRMTEFTDEAILANDMENLRILKYRIKEDLLFWNAFVSSCDHVLWDGENNKLKDDAEPTDADYSVHTCLCTLDGQDIDLEETRIILGDDTFGRIDIGALGEILINHRNWHLLSCIQDSDFDGFERIPFNQLDVEGRNILYYMLRKSTMNRCLGRFIIFNNLLKSRKAHDRLLVHFDGKSILAESFFHSEYPGGFRGTLPNFRVSEVENEIDDCRAELSAISCSYVTEKPCSFTNEEEDCVSRLNTLKLKSICRSEDARSIAEQAASNGHWELIVALLNTYIVVQSYGKRPTDHELIGNDCFELRSSGKLPQIFREALKRPRDKVYYVITAAEHILSIMDGDELSSIEGYIDEVALPDETKDYLRDSVRKRNESEPQLVQQNELEVQQGCQTYGPRVAFGPPDHSIRPAKLF